MRDELKMFYEANTVMCKAILILFIIFSLYNIGYIIGRNLFQIIN